MTALASRTILSELFAIDPDSPMLQTAEAQFQLQNDFSSGAYQVYTQHQGDADMNSDNYAVVLAAVWVETIIAGNGTISGAAYLASVMYQAAMDNFGDPVWSQQECTDSANAAWAVWNGLFTRKALDDTGATPYTGQLGVYMSPDIWVTTKKVDGPPFNDITTAASYAIQSPSAVTNEQNYIYVRGMNRFPGSLGGSVTLYQYKASLANNPSQWMQVQTTGGALSATIEPLASQEIFAALDSFRVNFSGTDHTCVTALVSTEFFPNPLPAPPYTNFNVIQWLSGNPATAWKNLGGGSNATNRLAICNLDDTPEQFEYVALCSHVPQGTAVRLHHAGNGRDGTLDTRAQKIESLFQTITGEVVLPPKYDGNLEVHIETPDGKGLPHGAVIVMQGYWVVPQGHPRHTDAAAYLARAGRSLHPNGVAKLYTGGFAFVGGVR